MKKLILILVAILLVASSLVTLSCGKVEDSGEVAGKTAQLGGLKITVNDAYFHERRSSTGRRIWEAIIVELTLKNAGKESQYLLFALYSNFYLQDAGGTVYRDLTAHARWEHRDGYKMLTFGLIDLELEPGETQSLILKFEDVPRDVRGLRLFCKEYAVEEGKRISIPLEI